MKKLLNLAFLLFFFSTTCFAQRTVVDTAVYKFNYATKYTSVEGLDPYDDEIVVEVGKNKTLCYGYWDEANSLAYDSIMAHGGTVADYLALGNPIGSFSYHILKNYPKKGMRTVTKYKGKSFIYTEPLTDIKWTLEDGDSTILGYPCKKASCTFRNRTWHVWYTLDIPLSEGPWKLDGLPGMILKAVDQKKQFAFDCIGIKENVNKPMSMELSKMVKVTPVYLERVLKLAISNRKAYAKLVGLNWIYSSDNIPGTACLLEYYEPNKK